MEFDKDLRSIQEARNLISNAVVAQKQLAEWDQAKIDKLCKAVTDACVKEAVPLAKMAKDETGFGKWEDKVLKNLLGSKMVYDAIKDMKTVGILNDNKVDKVIEVAVPIGVVVALIPSTNPTSTVMYKVLISLKAGNAIIISPHPNAMNCILSTVKTIQDACRKVGAPENIVQVVMTPTRQATDTLMKHPDTGIILATGGDAMVRAAYSSGNPALGVGPGNGPCYIERTADISLAVKRLIDSKTFDNGTICASEQSIITESAIKEKVVSELKKQHCHFMTKEESEKVSHFIMRANNTMNPQIVGKTALEIADMAGIDVPSDTVILITEHTGIGKKYPYSREKLCPILAFFTVKNWEEACEKAIELLENEGTGHTMVMHTHDEKIIREFGKKKPVSRVLVNTPAALGGVGVTTNLFPSLTLGCGAIGGSATSDNVGPENLFNVRRVAYGTKELEEIYDIGEQLTGVKIGSSSHKTSKPKSYSSPSYKGGSYKTPTISSFSNSTSYSSFSSKPTSYGSVSKSSDTSISESEVRQMTAEVVKKILAES
ncbi:MAG: acetaldehyde dehydrogenase (acetylating) [Ruminococcaceae bacterium]|nr:acetaldehyde dehydrogenase (acetylating) [Oscillospiraceae bacterium]